MRQMSELEKSYLLADQLNEVLRQAGMLRMLRLNEGPSPKGQSIGATYDYPDKIIDVFKGRDKTKDQVGTNIRHELGHNITDVNKSSNTERMAAEIAKGNIITSDQLTGDYLNQMSSLNISPYREADNQPKEEDIFSLNQRAALLKNLNNFRRVIIDFSRQRGTDPYLTPISDIYLGDVESAINEYSSPSLALPTRGDARVDEATNYTYQGVNSYDKWRQLQSDLGQIRQAMDLLKPEGRDDER